MLVASFRRADREHAFMVIVDEQDCGAAAEILFADADHLPEALEGIRAEGRADGLDIRTQALDPAELRWYVEEALQARADHDEEEPAEAASAMLDDEEEGPPYPVLALLVRARLAAMAEARMPAGARRRGHADASAVSMLDALATLLNGANTRPRGRIGRLAVWAAGAGQAAGEAEEVGRTGTDLPAQGGVAGREAADLAANTGTGGREPCPPARGHPGRVRLGRQPPARVRDAVR